jgi:hypothetical protein
LPPVRGFDNQRPRRGLGHYTDGDKYLEPIGCFGGFFSDDGNL